MSNRRDELQLAFQEVLTAFLDSGNEDALHRAYEIGRQSLSAGIGLLDLAQIEKRSLVGLVEARESHSAAVRIAAAIDLMCESLTPFEMTHLSFRETNASLQRLNSELVDRNEALARAHDLVRAIVDTLEAGIVTVDAAGKVLLANRCAREILGGDPAEVPVEDWIERFGILGADGRTPLPASEHPVTRARAGVEVDHLEIQIRSPSAPQEARWVWASSRCLGDIGATSRPTVLLLTDVTRHKKLERQMLQTERARVLALMAGSLVHDMKNILAVVALEAEALQEGALPPDESRACGDRLQRAATRGTGMLGRLLALGQSGPPTPSVLDPASLLEDTLDMVRRLLPPGIAASMKVESPLECIVADRAELEQCLMNLVLNSRDAMPEGGRLVLEATTVRPPAVAPHGSADWIEIAVLDTGTGMDESIRANLFEPFFSTKGQGKGTGLGLVSVLSLVHRNGGVMEVNSVPGEGSRFAMLFPAAHPVSSE